MFGDLFKSRPRKTAIKIIKIYDTIQMQPEILAAPPDITQKTIDDIKTHPKRYAYNVKVKDNLDGCPAIKIAELATPEYIEKHNVNVICEVTYTYVPPRIAPKHRLANFMLFMLVWAFIGVIGLIYWADEQSKQERIDTQCYYYMKNGVPKAITIEGYEYKLNPDGSLDAIDRVFLNPFHEEKLRGMVDGDCTIINTE